MTRRDKFVLLLLFGFLTVLSALPQHSRFTEEEEEDDSTRRIHPRSQLSRQTQLPQPPQQYPRSKRPLPVFKRRFGGLELPDNATSIRENIVDTFSCANRIYGYYADVENECQVFHVCMPQTRGALRWSFICPMETVFNQATFVCTRTEDSIPCEEAENYYFLNEDIGKEEENYDESTRIPENAQIDETVRPFAKSSRTSSRERASKVLTRH
ncbi:uncharacterized protein [Prorops nasuta]|uniref:uncharacterized protein n=1 Tax=Prorops nasuta TaxID=863751 RepID=UPI0034CFCA22